ncbi:MAG: phenylalanine--tRNA ligase subunit beta [bacterium]|jgi:phenylalanyl-tRNA synthetase beta chain
MKVLLSWLREFVDFRLEAAEIARGLTMQGTEAEGFTCFSAYFTEGCVAARVRAEKGEEDEGVFGYEIEIPDGRFHARSRARHIPPGFTILARGGGGPGAVFEIPTLAELGLNSLRFPLVIPDALGWNGVRDDAVLEFDTLSNRGDLLSHIGIAREVSILTGNSWREPAVFDGAGATDEKIARPIRLDAPDLCPRYIGMGFSELRIADSPDWMWYRLASLGVNPISNIVDITNYVLMELGQPLHAFDPARLDGGIIVRRAADGEKFTAINHNEYTLAKDNLVIADENKAVAIGGVMGGLESEVTEETRELFLESAYFTPVGIRKTSKRLGLMSDSSLRFGRGVDPEGTLRGALRFAYLAHELGAGRFVPGSFRDADERRAEPQSISFALSKVESLLGLKLAENKITGLLESAGFTVFGKPPVVSVTPPSWRGDLAIAEDLVEEVLRLYGYSKLEPSMPTLPLAAGRFEESFAWEARIRDICRSMGLQEIRTYSLVNPSVGKRWQGRAEGAPAEDWSYVEIANPDTAEMSVLRTSLAPGLVEVLTLNRRKHSEPIPVFYEVGRVYRTGEPSADYAYSIDRNGAKYFETRTLAFIVGEDSVSPAAAGPEFGNVSPLFAAKGIVRRLVNELVSDGGFAGAGPECPRWLERDRSVAVLASGKTVGYVGILRNELDAMEGARGRIAIAEINLDALRAARADFRRVISPSQFPAILRDLALVVPLETPAAELLTTIRDAAGGSLADAFVFDQFTGKRLAPREIGGKTVPVKNLAFSLRFQRADRTLTNDEVDRAILCVLSSSYEKHAAVLRDYEQVKSDSIFADPELWAKVLALYRASARE